MIVNMWWFYFIDIISGIGFLLRLIGCMLTVCCIMIAVYCILESKSFKHSRLCMILAFVSFFLSLFFPSTRTLYYMMVASNVTYENVELAKDGVVDVIDYVVDKIDVLLENNGEE